VWIRTDAYGQIGRKYLQAGWGKRVCQIYADSREWDTSAYPDGFFDSCLIDGGHTADIVENDTAIATRLVRPGGLVVWHDFCPEPDVLEACDSTRDVVKFIATREAELTRFFETLLWVSPSWLLFGVRNARCL
jgi:predicted O-methyltransferase YrrM